MNDKLKFNFRDITLSYERIGNGSKPVIAFHGFGQDSSVFRSWEPIAAEVYTIYSFDLFYHGSTWPYGDTPLKTDLWAEIFSSFLEKNGIQKFTLLSYSIGTRMALVLLDRIPGNIKQIILIAPDGLKLNFWYRLATGSKFTASLFHKMIKNPQFYLKLAGLAQKMKLIHPSANRFAGSQMRDVEKRERVYFTWMVMRKLYVSRKRISGILNKNQISLKIFAGEKDRIIPPRVIVRFIKRVENSQLIILKVEHHKLVAESGRWFIDHPGSL